MIIHDFHDMGIAILETKEDAPTLVRRHGPLPGPVTAQLMQPNTLERAQITKQHCRIEAS